MYAETTWRSWLDELGWVSRSATLRTRGLTPSDRRLARHLAALRRAWCDTADNSEEPCSDDESAWITDNDSDASVATSGAPESKTAFAKARLDTMIAERIATIHGLGIIDARDLEELDVCTISLRLGTIDTLDITLLQLRRIDELLARHTLGEATYRQMVADRQRAASNEIDRSIGGPPVPSICSPAQRKHAVEMSRNDELQGTPAGQRTPRLGFEAKRGATPQSEVPTAASLRILQAETPAHHETTNIMNAHRAEQISPTRDKHATSVESGGTTSGPSRWTTVERATSTNSDAILQRRTTSAARFARRSRNVREGRPPSLCHSRSSHPDGTERGNNV